MAHLISVDGSVPKRDEWKYQFILLELLGKVFFILNVNFRNCYLIVVDESVRSRETVQQLIRAEFFSYLNGFILEQDYFVN
jgi:hypothetical protein